jgi:AraC-like DNA-binding protein
MQSDILQILCSVLRVDMVHESEDGILTALFENASDSPLLASPDLRDTLRNGLRSQPDPFLFSAEYGCYFAGLRAGDGCLFMGPMCHEKLTRLTYRKMCRSYQVETTDFRSLPSFTLPEMRNMVLLTNHVLENASPEDEELLHLNRIIATPGENESRDKVRFSLMEEESDDDHAYRHSYREEMELMQAIREGRTKDAVRAAENMDRDSGRLSTRDLTHRRNLAIIGIALCSRAAIEGGFPPGDAYRLSGFYIQKCDTAQDAAHLLYYRNRAIEDFSDQIYERLNHRRVSGYVEQCKDYIHKHYREKISLPQVAEALGISSSYLSRLFRKETGVHLQDYIVEVRVQSAANLLQYSEFSLGDIAQYVHFPNQSYFGKVFREHKGMTPKAWRDTYKTAEFTERGNTNV